jgi:hypothetical protein
MADFGVYFMITNTMTGSDLKYVSSNLDGATYDGPQTIPADGQQHQVHLDDPFPSEGAAGTVNFMATVNGQMRQYSWYGSCPVVASNEAHGPGIQSWTGPRGHPNYIYIVIGVNTPPALEAAEDIRAARAAAAGKTPSDPKKTVKFAAPTTKNKPPKAKGKPAKKKK